MKTRVEYKIQISENQPWEKTPVHAAGTFETIHEILAVGTWLMRETGSKVRWNYAGLTQGQYIEVDEIGLSRKAYLRELESQERDFQNSIGRYLPNPNLETLVWGSESEDEDDHNEWIVVDDEMIDIND